MTAATFNTATVRRCNLGWNVYVNGWRTGTLKTFAGAVRHASRKCSA